MVALHSNTMRHPFLLLAAFPLLVTAARAASDRPLLPLPIPGEMVMASPADPGRFTFVVGGDNRSVARDLPPPPTAARIFAETRLLRPAFALWTGDSIYGSDDTPGEAAREYAAFLRLAAAGATPVFNAPGNHEIFRRPELERVYESCMGRLYGSFDYGRSHFIALDTEEADRAPGVGPAQLEWLRKDLEANRGAEHIFVFSHHPLFPTPDHPRAGFASVANRDEVHRLFVRYHVTAVFSGHEHLYYASVHDGVRYIVTGGGGAPSDGAPQDGGFQHYLLVSVDGNAVKIQVLQPWRLFEKVGPVQPDGSCTAMVMNYGHDPLSVLVAFPTDQLGAGAVATASWTYKGGTHPVPAEIVAPLHSGETFVRVMARQGRGTLVVLKPATK